RRGDPRLYPAPRLGRLRPGLAARAAATRRDRSRDRRRNPGDHEGDHRPRDVRARVLRLQVRSPMNFDDILYNKQDGIATITINRPKVLNAFRSQTVDEMVAAFQDAWAD